MHRYIKWSLVVGVFAVTSLVATSAVSAAFGEASSVVRIDGATTNFTALSDSDLFGVDTAAIGDVDGDGVMDIAVGAHGDDNGLLNNERYGAVYIIFLNSDGSVKTYSKIDKDTANFSSALLTDGNFGFGLEGIGDFNGDGIFDIAVAAPYDDTTSDNGGKIFLIYLTATGGVSGYDAIDLALEGVGNATAGAPGIGGIANLGDLDSNGTIDLAIGSYYDDNFVGAVHILFLNANGTLLNSTVINDATTGFAGALSGTGTGIDFFGVSVANVGDINGDGVVDLAVGSYYDEDTGTALNAGAVYILFLNTSGGVSSYSKISADDAAFSFLAADSYLGSGVSLLGDMDGNGTIEIAIGAELYPYPGGGAVFVTSINTFGEPVSAVEISSSQGGMGALAVGDRFGTGITSIGDLDGDGVEDLVVGAYRDDLVTPNSGAVHILFLEDVAQPPLLPFVEGDVLALEATGPFYYIDGNGMKRSLTEGIIMEDWLDAGEVQIVTQEQMDSLEDGLAMLPKGLAIVRFGDSNKFGYIDEQDHPVQMKLSRYMAWLFRSRLNRYIIDVPEDLYLSAFETEKTVDVSRREIFWWYRSVR